MKGDDRMGIIYCYTNKINGKKYVGQTINAEQRYNAHKSNYQNPNNTEYNSLIHKAFRKYGLDNFTFEILELCEIEKLNEFIQEDLINTENMQNEYEAKISHLKTDLLDIEQENEQLKAEMNNLKESYRTEIENCFNNITLKQ